MPKLTYDPDNFVPVAHLCPDILAAAKIIRRHVPAGHPDRKAALRHLRVVQDGVHQLRANQGKLVPKDDET